jgi:Tol biopolymer transport system component
MNTIARSLLSLIFMAISCFLITSCSNNPSFSLVFTAYDPQTDATGVYQFKSGDNSISLLTSVKDLWLLLRIVDVSHDGKTIYANYFSNETLNLGRENRVDALFLVNKGKPLQEILNLPEGISDAKLSPGGNQIAIVDEQKSAGLWVGNAKDLKSDNLKLVASSLWTSLAPSSIAWSPDGEYLAYTKYVGCSTDCNKYALYTEIYLINILNHQTQKLTDVTQGCIAPQWAATGKWIAMICMGMDDPSGKIIIVSPDGKNINTIKNNGAGLANILSYAWSPDGKLIAYICLNGNTATIHYSQADGTKEKIIPISLIKNIDNISEIVWTPDGKHLIILAGNRPDPENNPEKYNEQILITDLDGSDERILDNGLEDYNDLHIYE